MRRRRPHLGAITFRTASERFADLEEWLEYGRSLTRERPPDLWLRIRSGNEEARVPQGTTAAVDRWLVHVLRVYEPGIPGRLSQLGLVRADMGITPASLQRSTAAVAGGLDVPSLRSRTPEHDSPRNGVTLERNSAAIMSAGEDSGPVHDWEGTPSIWEGVLPWLGRIGLGITAIYLAGEFSCGTSTPESGQRFRTEMWFRASVG